MSFKFADANVQKEYLKNVLQFVHILKITQNGEDLVVRHPEIYLSRDEALKQVINVLALYQPPIVKDGKRYFVASCDDNHYRKETLVSSDTLLKDLTKNSGYRPYNNANGITIERLLDPVVGDDFYESDGHACEDDYPIVREPSYYWPDRQKSSPVSSEEENADIE